MPSAVIIGDGEQSIAHNSDPVVRGPIPNEREINREKLNFRQIRFVGEGSEVRQPSSLPFKPPGLQWNGGSSITTRQTVVGAATEQKEYKKKAESADYRSNK